MKRHLDASIRMIARSSIWLLTSLASVERTVLLHVGDQNSIAHQKPTGARKLFPVKRPGKAAHVTIFKVGYLFRCATINRLTPDIGDVVVVSAVQNRFSIGRPLGHRHDVPRRGVAKNLNRLTPLTRHNCNSVAWSKGVS